MVAKRELSKQKLDKFTTTDLIRTSNVSRSTVYYHFRNGINDVYKDTFQNNLIKPIISEAITWQDVLNIGINHIYENGMLYNNLYRFAAIGSRRMFINDRIGHIVNTVLDREIDYLNDENLKLDIFIGGVIYQITLWIETEYKEHPNQLIKRLKLARDMIYLEK